MVYELFLCHLLTFGLLRSRRTLRTQEREKSVVYVYYLF